MIRNCARHVGDKLKALADSNNLMKKVTEVNICLQNSCKKHNIELVDNSNIDKRGLSAKGLHLNMSGTTRLAMNFKALLNRF